jgi:hypothetical protein
MPSLENYSMEQLEGITTLMQTLANSPETRKDFLNLVKKSNPHLAIPEVDAPKAVLAELDKERVARQALEKRIQETELRSSIEKQRLGVQARYNFSEEDMGELEKMMLDDGLPSYDKAAKYLSQSRKLSEFTAAPTAVDGQFSMPDTNIWAKGFGNNGALGNIARTEAYKAFNEITGAN